MGANGKPIISWQDVQRIVDTVESEFASELGNLAEQLSRSINGHEPPADPSHTEKLQDYLRVFLLKQYAARRGPCTTEAKGHILQRIMELYVVERPKEKTAEFHSMVPKRR